MYRVEDYPQIQGSLFLKGRGEGASRILRGKIGVLTFFLTRGQGSWSKNDISKYYTALNEAERFLEKEAKRYGAPLEFVNYQYEYNIPAGVAPRDSFEHLKGFLNMQTVEDAQNYFEKTLCCSEVPFVYAFNESGRSFAWSQTKGYYAEESSSVFFDGGKLHWSTLAHELLHQFGACDYYFPEAIKVKAVQYFNDSVMGIGDYKVDDLTAYLIGWKDTISAFTYWFLKDTMWYNSDEYSKALKAEWAKKW